MNYRTLGRTGWQVSEIGYGMWGMGGWTGSDDQESHRSLDLAVELGCNFFDTAYAYGDGHSEKLLGQLVGRHPDQKLYAATKIPPKNRQWPSRRGDRLQDVFPADYIREMTETSLKNLGLDCVDLQQFHVWEDAWADDERWQRAVDDLKRRGPGPRHRRQHQPLGTDQRRRDPAHRADRRGASDLQHLRPGARG